MGFFAMLIRSLVMNDLHFNPLEISSTSAIAGLIVMPFPLLMGWLSDRIGRKAFLLIGYVISLLSFILLAFSRLLWNFWLVFIGQGIAAGTTGVVNALVTDLVQRQSLGKGLAMISSAAWIGGMVGFTIAGFSLQYLGLLLTFLIGSCFGLVAIALLLLIDIKGESIVFQGSVHE
jgi:MFS family permease